MFKIKGALSTMPLKFSVNFEEYLLKFSASHISFETSELQRHILKIKMAPDVLHYPFKGNVQPKIEKNWPNIYFEVFMKKNGAWLRSTQKIFKGNVRRKQHSSKFTENFKGIVLKAPLILNVNCAKSLQ